MTPPTRRRLVGTLLALLFAWPFAQQQLVLRYRLNPWKLAGWGMYTTVAPRVVVKLVSLASPDQRVVLDPLATPELAAAVERYYRRRGVLGLLADPAPVAAELGPAYPEHSRFVISVDEYGLTSQSEYGLTHHTRYRYRRGAEGLERVARARELHAEP